jgi:hypothetical protein
MPLLTFPNWMPLFLRNYREIRCPAGGADFPFGPLYPCLEERRLESGTASGQHFQQDLLVAGRIFRKNPVRHVDIGSRINGL